MTIDDAMRNHALKFTLEWGPERSIPLIDKLRRVYPQIDDATVRQLEKICNDVTSFAWRQFEQAFAKEISEGEASSNVRKQFPFVDADNLSQLRTQGMYYAWKG